MNGVLECSYRTLSDDYVVKDNVEVRKLDDFINIIPDDWVVAAVKIDIEGMEEAVFRSGKKFFKKHKIPYVSVEIE